MPRSNLLIIGLAFAISLLCYKRADRNRYAATLGEAMHLIGENYVEEVGYRELYENAMEGMVENLDPYSGYVSPTDYKQFVEGLDQEFGGIGILVEFNQETQQLMVMSPLLDTPAARQGVRAGDVILAVDGQEVAGVGFRDAVALIRGKAGETVRLTILHAGEEEPVELDIERAIIPIESILGDSRKPDGTWDFELQLEPDITYIRLITFGEQTVTELRTTLEGREVKALILDLRDNAGGLLDAAVQTCDLFLNDGMIVTTRGRGGDVRRAYSASRGTILDRDVPMAILVNRFSASASEIVAACLQDHQRALVVGQRTWGKGTVQNVIELEGGKAALKLTTASYWRPSGVNIHRTKDATDEDDWGVRPSDGFLVDLSDEQSRQVRIQRRRKDGFTINESEVEPDEGDSQQDGSFVDPQLGKAVKYLQEQLSKRLAAAS